MHGRGERPPRCTKTVRGSAFGDALLGVVTDAEAVILWWLMTPRNRLARAAGSITLCRTRRREGRMAVFRSFGAAGHDFSKGGVDGSDR